MLKPSFTVIDKAEMPEGRTSWLPIFDHLPAEKVIRFDCDSWNKALSMLSTIQQCCRNHRRPYQVHCRRVKNTDGTAKLYCWKKARDGTDA